MNITIDEYQHIQQQLNSLTEIQNKFDVSQQRIMN